MKNNHAGVLLLAKLQASVGNFTKSDTPARVFFTFFELYKCYQIAQGVLQGFLYNPMVPVNGSETLNGSETVNFIVHHLQIV